MTFIQLQGGINLKRKRLTEDGIRNAIGGEPNAVRHVLTYYSGYMTTLATRSVCDEDGSRKYTVNEELRSQLETKLILAILAFQP